ncbi:MAG: Possible monoamine oxidase [uncultured Thiotrichaceae bacterium]|uniref:Possible monoamine oxidase n=1 Tax=uncultured Thiotrichaceae bacterium TaxID=298394 RepID=A0A6S6SFD1_9GAMM|nr:MAG: Possible monoamine oxidase [uncultured Thiotrichaceae bacterium]
MRLTVLNAMLVSRKTSYEHEAGTLINTDILIVGGGISGLHTAYELEKQHVDFILVEARERFGGRILSNNYDIKSAATDAHYAANKPAYDLGPSWFWPGQNNMAALVRELDLAESVFSQQGSGEPLYEDRQGYIQKGFYGISMAGAYRMQGGIRQIISGLEQHIRPEKLLKNTRVHCVECNEDGTVTTTVAKTGSGNERYQINSKQVVMALPPRIAMSAIEFKPFLPASRVTELNSYATWMAGHAKILVVYERPFWLEQGLSGDAVSQRGPLREIHDASSNPANADDKNGYALFGFVGVPGSDRKGKEDELCQTAIAQLVRLFGDEMANPLDVVLQDWAQEAFTATPADQAMNGGHATASVSRYTEAVFDERLIWSGTETAHHREGANGLLEGALEASVRTVQLLTKQYIMRMRNSG